MDVHDPLDDGPFPRVNPDGDASARFEQRSQTEEGPAWIGRVIEHADRIDMVEATMGKWQTKQVTLHDGHRGQIRRQISRGHHRLAEIETHDAVPVPARPRLRR